MTLPHLRGLRKSIDEIKEVKRPELLLCVIGLIHQGYNVIGSQDISQEYSKNCSFIRTYSGAT